MTDSGLTTERLIALGRDREAVASATRQPTHPSGDPMNGAQQLGAVIPLLRDVVAGIAPDQLDEATPCKSFSVTGVLEHMIAGATAFAPAFRGTVGGAAEGDGDPVERWQAAMTDLLDAVQSPGALERTIASPFGEVSGDAFARYVAFDGLIHGWDLSTASGQPYAPPVDLVAQIDGFARGLIGPPMRDGDTFAAETEPRPDATALERLVAFSGREVTS